jgi:NAD(P)-dependent dehydrogenase (short-subunit alcohol dehydrogenase family)
VSDLPLHDRTALVTSASRGTGRTSALRIAELGADVLVDYVRDADSADEVVLLPGMRTRGRADAMFVTSRATRSLPCGPGV